MVECVCVYIYIYIYIYIERERERERERGVGGREGGRKGGSATGKKKVFACGRRIATLNTYKFHGILDRK